MQVKESHEGAEGHFHFLLQVFMMTLIFSCAPTVQVNAPEKPIVINLNISIEHKIKVQIDKELDKLMESEKGLF